ncbi:hypothetical protein FE257_004998 [Aspergillus nanangensis]|uniref:Major facilitator superfamily (MFS) profile domain-containing protein n=1 Tax=Aspergillus nanangensis TaxID=2582783 RepID=A0AAD4CSP8_ASPNN|nr:hypothetical protein FE257_004998 [Aspergillus nanangensis]
MMGGLRATPTSNTQQQQPDALDNQLPASFFPTHSVSKQKTTTAIDRKTVLRKMDLHLLPTLTVLYLFAFLDRGNIGNARIEGMEEDLHMKGSQYNWALTVFFFPYAALELPANMLLKRVRASLWLPSLMVAWGIVMTCMGLVQGYSGLLITQSGLYPGVAYYITTWYCREESQLRQAIFFSAASIAGAFSGLLAFAIGKLDGVAGYSGWRWIFILEGIATVLVAVGAYFLVYDSLETAPFLTADERLPVEGYGR